MCGRYALYGPTSRIAMQFDVEVDDFDQMPHDLWNPFNIAPTQTPPVVRARPDGTRELVLARWGLLPSWVKEPAAVVHPINAKLETAAAKPMFRHAFKHSRVLVPASGFYEWQAVAGHKQPYFVRPAALQCFGFAGLLERWRGPEGDLLTFAILTTAANESVRPIHDRMPVIIQPADYAAWLDPQLVDADLVCELAGEFPPALMEAYPVGRAVGNPRAEGPELIEPADDFQR
ncbi:SOS response-associated peptidase [Aromatoleum toluclasticum]|uniref:SOS response-associated peptidase n=1 Tax=Aromatoleum toluclasticum TaxID=92003 RepID=UPI00035C1031|nr:SOS response-associated peptidase [Aromatoleum toluclasticum]